MNRQQSEHILDAYVLLRMCGGEEEAADALREVILDAMVTERVVKEQVVSTYPRITLPATGNPPSYPYATWVGNSTKATCIGTDPLFDSTTEVTA